MWVYFNQNGQVITALEHGEAARVGTTAFSIFAVFENIDNVHHLGQYSATIKLRRPDLTGSSYPVLLMSRQTLEFTKLSGEGDTGPFENGHSYCGFLFNFGNFNTTDEEEVLLDTDGLWEAVITVIRDDYNVQGTVTFEVVGVGSDDEHEMSYDVVTNQLVKDINSKAAKDTVIITIDSLSPEDVVLSDYEEGQMFYNKDDNAFYRLTSGQLVQKSIDIVIDSELSNLSENPVQNRLVKNALDELDSTNGYYRVPGDSTNKTLQEICDIKGFNTLYVVSVTGTLWILKVYSSGSAYYGELCDTNSMSYVFSSTSPSTKLCELMQYQGANAISSRKRVTSIRYINNTNTTLYDFINLNITFFELSGGQGVFISRAQQTYTNEWSWEIESLFNAQRWFYKGNNQNIKLNQVMVSAAYRSDYALQTYVDTNIQNVREVAEGKCKTYILSYADTVASIKQVLNQYNRIVDVNGNDITQAWLDGDYDNVSLDNASFNSSDNRIYALVPPNSLVFRSSVLNRHNFIYVTYHDISNILKTGDIVLVIEIDVPDRWYGGDGYDFYKLETAKVDVTGYAETNGDNHFTGSNNFTGVSTFSGSLLIDTMKSLSANNQISFSPNPADPITFYNSIVPNTNNTYDIGSSTYKWKDLYLSGSVKFGSNAYIDCSSSALQIHIGTTLICDMYVSDTYWRTNFSPATTNSKDLGATGNNWRDLYLGGTAYISTIDSSSSGLLLKVNGTNRYTFAGGYIAPNSNGSADLGLSFFKWKDFYLSGNISDGTNSITVANIQPKLVSGTNIKTINGQDVTGSGNLQISVSQTGLFWHNVTLEDSLGTNTHLNIVTTDSTQITSLSLLVGQLQIGKFINGEVFTGVLGPRKNITGNSVFSALSTNLIIYYVLSSNNSANSITFQVSDTTVTDIVTAI